MTGQNREMQTDARGLVILSGHNSVFSVAGLIRARIGPFAGQRLRLCERIAKAEAGAAGLGTVGPGGPG